MRRMSMDLDKYVNDYQIQIRICKQDGTLTHFKNRVKCYKFGGISIKYTLLRLELLYLDPQEKKKEITKR